MSWENVDYVMLQFQLEKLRKQLEKNGEHIDEIKRASMTIATVMACNWLKNEAIDDACKQEVKKLLMAWLGPCAPESENNE